MIPVALIQIIVALVLVGLALWIVQQIPMDPAIAKVVRVVIVVVVAIWLLYLVVGLLGGAAGVPLIRR